MFQIQSPSLRPLTTAHLAQTMTLLNQTVGELWEQIQKELTNPARELIEERRCPICQRLLPGASSCPRSRPTSMDLNEPVVFISPREIFCLAVIAGIYPDEPIAALLRIYRPMLRQIAVNWNRTSENCSIPANPSG